MSVIHTHLTDGTPVCIRRVRKDDEQRMRDGIAQMTPRSRYLRFFSGMTEPPQIVIDRLLDADGHKHIAWGAVRTDLESRPALGVVHAFRDEDDTENAEFSVAVIDDYHGRGLARLLTAVLLLDCRRERLTELTVHILADNNAAIALARSLGGKNQGQERAVTEFEINIEDAIEALASERDWVGLTDIFAQFPDRE
jgi:GNAT superfamily N-acetyltransferase